MPDFWRSPSVTLSFGLSGYGKTTFCYRYLVNALTPQPENPEPACGIFIFDWKQEASLKLGFPACTTQTQCEAALASRVVCFNPLVAFPGDAEIIGTDGKPILNDERAALRWFAQWVFTVCQRIGGRKILYVDELREFGNKFSVMPEINRILRMGRIHGLQFLTSTQYPRDYHVDIRASVTEWVCFNTTEPDDLDVVRPYFSGVDECPKLEKGEFIAYSRPDRTTLRGKMDLSIYG